MSVTMKWLPLALALSLGTTTAVAEEAWQQQEQAREQQAQQDLASVSKELNSARDKLAAAQSLSKQLAAEFAGNEKQLVELNAQWEQASGDMNEIFAVTRQGASNAVKLLSESAVEGQYPERLASLKAMAQEKQVPDRAALALLPAAAQADPQPGRVRAGRDEFADLCGLGRIGGTNALAAAAGCAYVVGRGPLAEALLRDDQQFLLLTRDEVHTDDDVVRAQAGTTDTTGGASHRPDVAFVEADSLTGAGADDDILGAVGRLDPTQ